MIDQLLAQLAAKKAPTTTLGPQHGRGDATRDDEAFERLLTPQLLGAAVAARAGRHAEGKTFVRSASSIEAPTQSAAATAALAGERPAADSLAASQEPRAVPLNDRGDDRFPSIGDDDLDEPTHPERPALLRERPTPAEHAAHDEPWLLRRPSPPGPQTVGAPPMTDPANLRELLPHITLPPRPPSRPLSRPLAVTTRNRPVPSSTDLTSSPAGETHWPTVRVDDRLGARTAAHPIARPDRAPGARPLVEPPRMELLGSRAPQARRAMIAKAKQASAGQLQGANAARLHAPSGAELDVGTSMKPLDRASYPAAGTAFGGDEAPRDSFENAPRFEEAPSRRTGGLAPLNSAAAEHLRHPAHAVRPVHVDSMPPLSSGTPLLTPALADDLPLRNRVDKASPSAKASRYVDYAPSNGDGAPKRHVERVDLGTRPLGARPGSRDIGSREFGSRELGTAAGPEARSQRADRQAPPFEGTPRPVANTVRQGGTRLADPAAPSVAPASLTTSAPPGETPPPGVPLARIALKRAEPPQEFLGSRPPAPGARSARPLAQNSSDALVGPLQNAANLRQVDGQTVAQTARSAGVRQTFTGRAGAEPEAIAQIMGAATQTLRHLAEPQSTRTQPPEGALAPANLERWAVPQIVSSIDKAWNSLTSSSDVDVGPKDVDQPDHQRPESDTAAKAKDPSPRELAESDAGAAMRPTAARPATAAPAAPSPLPDASSAQGAMRAVAAEVRSLMDSLGLGGRLSVGMDHAEIELESPSLGKISARVGVENGVVDLTIASHAAAALTAELESLRAMLIDAGLQVGDMKAVSAHPVASTSQNDDDRRRRHERPTAGGSEIATPEGEPSGASRSRRATHHGQVNVTA